MSELHHILDRDPATVYDHVRQLAEVGFLDAGTVRTGPSGALEKPYRATQNTSDCPEHAAAVVVRPQGSLTVLDAS